MPRALTDDERRFRKAKADLAELEVANRRGALIEKARVLELLAGRAMVFRRALRGVARRLAPRVCGVVDPGEIQTMIEEAHDSVLWAAFGRPPAEIVGNARKRRRVSPPRLDRGAGP